MVQLLNKTIKRAVSVLIAAVMFVSTLCMLVGCQSSTPKVTIRISFEGQTYSISYRLYRKFFPGTVQHFIELADAGYYDGLCIHDYQEGAGMFTGGYEYNEATSGDDNTRGLVEREYFSWIEKNNVQLTQSVFKYATDGTVPTEGLNTVVGEFSANNYTIENNDKNYGKKKDGALVMYYTDKSEANETKVTVKRNTERTKEDDWEKDAQWYEARSYSMNSATSLFYISLTSGASVEKDYCVFGELYNDDAADVYDELLDAIEEYIEKNITDEDDSFTQSTTALELDQGDWYYKNYNLTATYEVPVSPIVIQSVKVNRY